MSEAKTLTRMVLAEVVSSAMDKSIVVRVDRRLKHKRLHKYITISSKLTVHDENNSAKVGDKVLIVEGRPISKNKSWALLEVVNHNQNEV